MMKNRSLLFCIFSLVILAFIGGCKTPDSPPQEVGPAWVTFKKGVNSPLLDNHINGLCVDAEGRVWMATDSGANAYFNGTWVSYKDSLSYTTFSTSGSSTGRRVTAITEGKGNTIWFGLGGGGVVRFNRYSSNKIWQRFTQNDIPFNTITSLTAEKLQLGEVWVATFVGAARWVPDLSIPDRGIWSTYDTHNSNLPQNNIQAVGTNPLDNSYWFGTYDEGLVRFDGTSQWQTYPIPPSYDVHITSVAFDASNNVWIGRWRGASKLNVSTSEWKHFTNSENSSGKMPNARVNTVATNLQKTRWFGTEAGLVQLKDTAWSLFNRSSVSELPSDTITALAMDRKGNLWIGTAQGLSVFRESGTDLK